MSPRLAVAIAILLGCDPPRAPDALRPAPRAAPRDGGAPELDDRTLRARLGLLDGGAALRRARLRAPLDVDLVVIDDGSGRRAVALDRGGEWRGLAGASRVIRGWRARGYEPFTEDLARVLALFARPDAALIGARTVVEVDGEARWVAAPTSARLPSGAQVVTLSARGATGAIEAMQFSIDGSGAVREVRR